MVLVGCACSDTSETRAWIARRDQLQARERLLKAWVADADEVELRRQTWARATELFDVPGSLRAHQSGVQVFPVDGHFRATFEGTLASCREELNKLASVHWLLPRWSLRLDGTACQWRAESSDEVDALRDALQKPAPVWKPPPTSMLSRGVDALRADVEAAEKSVEALERTLSVPALDEALLARATALQWPGGFCELAIVERAEAQDVPLGLLEVTFEKTIHPLEPRNDRRLSGLVEVRDGGVAWQCEFLE